MTGSSYEEEQKIEGSKNRHSEVQITLLILNYLPLQMTVTQDAY
jgi:hypothetical protein